MTGRASDAAIHDEFVRDNIAAAYRLMLATLELQLVKRAELEAKIARIQCALDLNDDSVLREGHVALAASSDLDNEASDSESGARAT